MKLPDQDTSYVMATFRPGESDKRILKLMAYSLEVDGVVVSTPMERFRVCGNSTVFTVDQLGQWLPEKKRQTEIEFLLYYFAELVRNVSNLGVQEAAEFRADDIKFRTFLQAQWTKALKEYEKYFQIDEDFKLIDAISNGAGLQVHKVVGADKFIYVQERNCSF